MKLSKVLKCYRYVKQISLRVLSKEIGISESTLSRIENGKYLPDLITFNKVLTWLIKK